MKHFMFVLVTAAALALPVNANAAAYCAPKVVGNTGYSGGNGLAFGVIGCAAGVVLAALAKNAAGKGELTSFEAATCGFGTLFTNH